MGRGGLERLSGTVSKVLYENAETGYGVLHVDLHTSMDTPLWICKCEPGSFDSCVPGSIYREETGEGTVRACGTVPFPASGERIAMSGLWEIHPDHGRQFAFLTVERALPDDALGVQRFLMSGVVHSLGTVALYRVVERFQGDALRILLQDPLLMTEIPGVAADKALAASHEVRQHLACRELAQWLATLGIAPVRAQKAVSRLGMQAAALIRENPWRLQEPGMDVLFQEADKAALACGFGIANENRIRAALDWILRAAEAEGDTCLPEQILRKRMLDLLGAVKPAGEVKQEEDSFPDDLSEGTAGFFIHSDQFLEAWLGPMQMELSGDPYPEPNLLPAAARVETIEPFRSRNRLVYSKRMMEIEELVAAKVLDLQACSDRISFILKDSDWAILDELAPWGWDDWQKQVFLDAGTHGVTVITGGPGTGKTTLIRGLVRLFADRGFEIALTAPTGRAARRMSDATGMEAKTIHRLLEVAYDVKDDEMLRFRRNADFQLEAEVVIVDEASMLDLPLFNALLQACATGTRLVLVGDADQLPPVGVGRVLGDLIDSGRLPVVRLQQVFRQSDGSRIAANAQGILAGRFPEFSDEWGEFHLVRRYKAEEVAKAVVQLCHQELPERYGFNPHTDIQVLAPMRKGIAGVANLNLRLRDVLNPEGKRCSTDKKSTKDSAISGFREGDRVMQNRNDYQLAWTSLDAEGNPFSGEGVYNGDMGTLTDFSPKSRTATILFDDGRQADYSHDRMDSLEPAYAVTVHKSQGSEYPVVVLPLFGLPDSLACRNLLYTAITRARQMVVIVGTEAMLERMIRNNRNMERYSGLALRLREGMSGA